LTSDGNLDRGPVLASPKVSVRGPESLFPESSAEIRLRALCRKVLRTDPVRLDQGFFEIGLNSLSAATLAWLIEKELHVHIRLSAILDNPTIGKLLKLIEAGSRNEPERADTKLVDGLPRPKSIPLSFAQEQVWFLEKLHPQLNSYRFQALLNCRGTLNTNVLERSLNRIVSRHAILRTAFVAEDGESPRQDVRPHVPLPLPREDLRAFPANERQKELERRIEEELRRPFHLSRPPLIRWRLYQLDEQKYTLLHTEHHFVHDGWSYGVFLEELYATYSALLKGESLPTEPEPAQFADFALWQREMIASAAWDHQLEYWRKELADCPPPPALPSDRRLGRHRSFRGLQIRNPIPEALWTELGQACSREGVTRFAWIQAVFHLFIHLYTRAEDFCTGTGFANRRDPRFQKMLGMAINTLPIRARFEGIATFRDLLRRTRDTLRFALDNQEPPFEMIVKDLNPGREANTNPFFNAFVASYDTAYPNFADESLEMTGEHGISCGQVKFDLVALFIPGQDALAGGSSAVPLLLWEFSSELFDFSTGECMLDHFLGLLRNSIHQPEAPVGSLSMAQDEEAILAFGRGPESPPECATPLHRLFESVAASTPDAPALVAGETALTYGELNIRANKLARRLADRGITEGSVAAVALPRGPEAIVCFLAILKAGGAYLPIDLRDPADRISCLLRLAETRIVLTHSSLAQSLRASVAKAEVCFVDETLEAAEGDLPISVSASSPAYVLFTSGSTGVPKGVIVPHCAVSRLVFGLPIVHLDRSEIVLHLAPLSFDASTFEIWGALLHGAKLVISSEDLPDFRSLGATILWHGITTTWLTSSLFNEIVDTSPEILRGLRQVLTGGEALSPSHIRKALDLLPGTRIINGYGPTETTTFATLFQVASNFDQNSRAVPIGRPIAGTQVYVLSSRPTLGEIPNKSPEIAEDSSPQLAPIGVPGELYIGGEGVALGYLNLPELTAQRFVADPFAGSPGRRLYKTGDLVRWRPDGNLDFLGRIDGQVKIRGFRIEPAEIEAVLERHPSVNRAVVNIWEPAPGEKQLAAYYETENHDSLKPEDLLNYLSGHLPRYMLPEAFIKVEKLPLGPTGKIDRRALSQLDRSKPERTNLYVAPRNAVEKQLTAIWSRLLDVERVGILENFFELGGHSLIATRIVSQIRREFDVEIPLRAVFENSTIEGLAREITLRQRTPITSDKIEELLSELESLPEEGAQPAIIEVKKRA
jgi:amino acid adenylation domain-containing protein